MTSLPDLFVELTALNQRIVATLIENAIAADAAEQRGRRAEQSRHRQNQILTVAALALTGATIPTDPPVRAAFAVILGGLAAAVLILVEKYTDREADEDTVAAVVVDDGPQ